MREVKVYLNKFQLRDYQKPLWDALNRGYKRLICVAPRRMGKDLIFWNWAIRSCILKPIICYYLFPDYRHCRKAIWDAITISGQRFIDYVPEELVENINNTEMKIRFKGTGSILQLVGSDNYNSLVGTNPSLCIFSEFALQLKEAYQFLAPALQANGGTAIFISTPRGKNHFYEMFQAAQYSTDWFTYHLTLEDTNHIPLAEIQKEIDMGLMSADLVQQEYFCSFDRGISGAIWGEEIDRMHLMGQIGNVPWIPSYPVQTAWDIGVSDSCCILFWQKIGQDIRIIDCYENNRKGIPHYVDILNSKPWKNSYGTHWAPHDIRVMEFGSGITRFETARQLGVFFKIANTMPSGDLFMLEDGIEAVRATIPRIWIDESNCKRFIKCIENYRREWDSRREMYKDKPIHDWASHFADCLRYLCLAIPKMRDGMTEQDVERQRREALHGQDFDLPPLFRPTGFY